MSAANTAGELGTATLGAHELIENALDQATRDSRSAQVPARQLADAFTATTCRHLATVGESLLPIAQQRLDDGRALVSRYLMNSRGLERRLGRLKGRLYGDVHAAGLSASEMCSVLTRDLREHEELEAQMVHELAVTLSGSERTALVRQIRRAEEHSPTRPHPGSPHVGRTAGLCNRVWAVWDGLWDNVEGRLVPQPTGGPGCGAEAGDPRDSEAP